jgi:hypothetical protein
LGYIGILTEKAFKITSHRGNGKGKTPRKKMKERFFFDGVDMPGYELAVHKCLQYTGSIFTDIAYASLSLFDDTALVAEVALDAFVLEGFKKISIHRIFSLPASTGYGPGGLFGTVFKFK